MEINIRHETANDYLGIKKVNDLAFGQPVEGLMVEKLRKNPDFIEKLSIVAEVNEKVVGHILFFSIKVKDNTLEHVTLSLAPMAVIPELQGKGIGSKLVIKGLETAKELGFRSVIVLGHMDYYPKFGFTPASNWGIKAPFDVPDKAFMAMELTVNGLKGISGTVIYPKEIEEAV